MSDSNKQDPLEKFFQKKSGDYDISYREEDWNSLESRLDALDAQLASRRRRRLAAAAVVVIVSLLSYFVYQNYQEINSLNEQLSRQEQQAPPTAMSPKTDTLGENTIPAEELSEPDVADMQELPENAGLRGKSEGNRNSGTATSGGEALADVATTEQNRPGLQTETPIRAISSLECVDCTLPDKIYSEPTAQTLQLGHYKPKEGTTPFSAQTSGHVASKESKPGMPESGNGKFSIGLVLGPDMSTAGNLSNFYEPGSKFGFTVEYKINKNWAVSAGAIRSKVNYKAGSQDYDPPAGYWYNGIQATQTKAQCIIIDIPINLSYRFLNQDRSRFYASAGLSSYIMLNEDYRFSYDYEQPDFPQRWNEDTGTAHLMSNANISVGYEYDVTKRMSLRAEPFFRVPLREVGWGNVNLYSMGTLVSINYNLNAF